MQQARTQRFSGTACAWSCIVSFALLAAEPGFAQGDVEAVQSESNPSRQAEEQDSAKLAKLRGVPRFLGELDQLERYGELQRLTSNALDRLLDQSGAGTVPALLRALSSADGNGDTPISEARRGLIDAALTAYPDWVVGELRGSGSGSASTTRRIHDALQVLEAQGGAPDLATVRELVDPHDPEARLERGLMRAYETALTAMLKRDQRAVRQLADDWDDWPDNLWIPTVKSVGGSSNAAGLDLLIWLLRDAEGTQEFLVQQIGRVVESAHLPGDFALHSTLIQFADSQNAALRREACVTLGKLQCAEAIEMLIDRLTDPHSSVRESAIWSLHGITGKSLKAEPERWRLWHESEARWWRDEYRAIYENLSSDDPAVIGVAIRELGRRKLHRHELARDLLPLLDDPRESVQCMTIAGLGALGSAVAVEPLAQLLDSEFAEVRKLALQALESITGRSDLPADRSAWSNPWQRS